MKTMKKRMRQFFVVIGIASLCVGIVPLTMSEVSAAAKITVTKTLTLQKGEKGQIEVSGTKKKKRFSSSKKKVATVSKKGVVTAKKVGKATIRVKIGKKTYKTKVIVTAKSNNSVSAPATAATCRILFVGNSKTYAGDIPGQFRQLAEAAGHKVEVDSVTEGGWQLTQFASDAAKKARITAKAYDFVVLQEQSQICQFGGTQSPFYQGAKAIADLARQKNPNCRIVMRQTWVYQNSVENEKQWAYDAAEQVAAALGTGLVSRDGKAMYYADAKGLSVFGDNTHQNTAGAYLCACCVYKTIYGNPVGNGYKAGMGNTAGALQGIANQF